MSRIEELALETYRAQLHTDLGRLVDKYRAIFGWDLPAVDENFSKRLVITSLRTALDDLQQQLPGDSQTRAENNYRVG
jgi:hypothetical protein